MHWNILDEQRKNILPLFAELSNEGFYLAGGTALALQIGHRDSIDFDFFKEQSFDTEKLFAKLEQVFKNHKILKTQEEHNTLGVVVDETIKISFMSYNYVLLKLLIESDYFPLASITDIGCMKLSAITSRSVLKDYVDLYFILKQISLREMIMLCETKFPNIDGNLILKSLVYFDDVHLEPIMFKENHDVDFETIKKFLKQEVAKLY